MGEQEYYMMLAEQERQRQRNIAQSYWNAGPSIGNLYNAAQAYWNSLPFVGISPADMNPYVQMGVAPTPGKAPLKSSSQKQIVPRKTSQLRSTEYYREKVEDKNLGIFKRQRLAFNVQQALSDGDMRHVNSGRPSMKQIRAASQNIQNYPRSALKEYNKLVLKGAKKGYTVENMLSYRDLRDFLYKMIDTYGHIY